MRKKYVRLRTSAVISLMMAAVISMAVPDVAFADSGPGPGGGGAVDSSGSGGGDAVDNSGSSGGDAVDNSGSSGGGAVDNSGSSGGDAVDNSGSSGAPVDNSGPSGPAVDNPGPDDNRVEPRDANLVRQQVEELVRGLVKKHVDDVVEALIDPIVDDTRKTFVAVLGDNLIDEFVDELNGDPQVENLTREIVDARADDIVEVFIDPLAEDVLEVLVAALGDALIDGLVDDLAGEIGDDQHAEGLVRGFVSDLDASLIAILLSTLEPLPDDPDEGTILDNLLGDFIEDLELTVPDEEAAAALVGSVDLGRLNDLVVTLVDDVGGDQVAGLVEEFIIDVDTAIVGIFVAILSPLPGDPEERTILNDLLSDFIQDLVRRDLVDTILENLDAGQLERLIDESITDLGGVLDH